MHTSPPSRKAVKRSASTIRKFYRGESFGPDFEDAIDTLLAFRSGFAKPLVSVNGSLRGFCLTDGIYADVTQRLKKTTTILDKLTRHPQLDLSKMQDIGGCRVVTQNIEDLRTVEKRIRRRWATTLKFESDYITTPRESGYRGLHLIVERHNHLIEVQLRTQLMHHWALTVERFSTVAGQNLKQDGNHVIQEFMKLHSRHDATVEGLTNEPFSPDELDKLRRLRPEVLAYLGVASN